MFWAIWKPSAKHWALPYLSTNLTKKDGFYLETPKSLHGRETYSISLNLEESDYKIETHMPCFHETHPELQRRKISKVFKCCYSLTCIHFH